MDLLLGQTTTVDWVGPVIQLTTAGGFGALLWFLVWKRMPEQEQAAREERKEWLSYMQQRDAKFEQLIEKCVRCIEESNNARNP